MKSWLCCAAGALVALPAWADDAGVMQEVAPQDPITARRNLLSVDLMSAAFGGASIGYERAVSANVSVLINGRVFGALPVSGALQFGGVRLGGEAGVNLYPAGVALQGLFVGPRVGGTAWRFGTTAPDGTATSVGGSSLGGALMGGYTASWSSGLTGQVGLGIDAQYHRGSDMPGQLALGARGQVGVGVAW